ncbi:ATP-dependent nuclease [Thalassobellus suaedae]|uniref:AAA family ATPase n=1 Tax=Thalassobellus suaedae TaxID=3074124 RepID=A0ABY9XP42_9FLAO|nr:AAA family ATPase [Flavobacteriaceae bacterium HL-DH14]
MKFIVGSIKNVSKPFFNLYYNDWDDFKNRTTYYIHYHDKSEVFKVGDVKILHKDWNHTNDIIPPEFDSLPDDFCSLGQNLNYYYNLKKLFPEEYELILDALNDVAFFKGVKEQFESLDGFKHSLLRESSAQEALYLAKNKLHDIPSVSEFKFSYSCKLSGAQEPHTLRFNFGDNDNLPNRIIALIGKNGTGKTKFLANLAIDLSGISRKKLKEDIFIPQRPLFSKVIAISYSIFDKFSKPKSDRSFSYKYCGLKDSNGRLISNKKMSDNYTESINKITSKDLQNDWYQIMSIILDANFTESFYSRFFETRGQVIDFDEIRNELSSGQSFLMYVITEVIANINPNTLILFDEPEMHLHPNAIANLVRMFEKLLSRFESYALIATHSPIIIQEIPSRYVNVFEREGNIPMVYNLGIESFGENIEVLTQEVFKTKDVDENYKVILKNLSIKYSYKTVLSFFENKLSLNAKTYLLAQYKNPEAELDA